MDLLFLGLGVFGLAASLAVFWYCLPKNGKMMPLVGTVWEPYVAIAITMGCILSVGSIAVAIVDYFV